MRKRVLRIRGGTARVGDGEGVENMKSAFSPDARIGIKLRGGGSAAFAKRGEAAPIIDIADHGAVNGAGHPAALLISERRDVDELGAFPGEEGGEMALAAERIGGAILDFLGKEEVAPDEL